MSTSVTGEAEQQDIPFSQFLRASTRSLHDKAQNSSYMRALSAGKLDLSDYVPLVVQYHFIYKALEDVSDAMASDPVGGQFVTEELRRMPAIARDLEALIGADWESRISPLPATEAYTSRIRATYDWPGGFVAHHYTRYLGDIAGGQILRRTLEQTYQLSEVGAHFYRFDELGPAPAFRDRYRSLLNSAPWSARERAEITDEANRAFECNIAVFGELAAELGDRLG